MNAGTKLRSRSSLLGAKRGATRSESGGGVLLAPPPPELEAYAFRRVGRGGLWKTYLALDALVDGKTLFSVLAFDTKQS